MKDIVIVGGGLAGIVAALALKGKRRVTLVEKAAECGGLMRSFVNRDGVAFDYGTHVPSETGDAEVDAVLFDRIRNESWRCFRVLNTGSFFAGKLYDRSPHVDLRSLPKTIYDRAVAELLAPQAAADPEPKNFAEQLRRDFGATVTDSVQRPVIRKIFACELEDLLPDNPFVLKRFVVFDDAESRDLKKEPRLDAKLAFASFEEGVPSVSSFYPKHGGVGQWMLDICAELERGGVTLATGRGVSRIEHKSGAVEALILDDGRRLECDTLFWTAPPFLLLKAMDLKFPIAPLKARPMSFFHFRFDRPFLCRNYYVTNYDESFRNFRVTIYPNLQERAYGGIHHCTVEVIGDGVTAVQQQEIRTELEVMGVIDPEARTISCDYDFLPIGFPTLTKAFLDAAHAQVELVRNSTRRVQLLGRAKHDNFAMQTVALEAYHGARHSI